MLRRVFRDPADSTEYLVTTWQGYDGKIHQEFAIRPRSATTWGPPLQAVRSDDDEVGL